jgi:hypothetical protein
MDPFTAMGSVPFAGIASCFKLVEFAQHLSEVGPESQVFIRLIQIVRTDLQETERLSSIPAVRRRIERTPRKIEWIETALQNTRFALNEIGRWVEDARVDQQSKGSVQFQTRVRWVLQDHDKIVNRQAELSACHQQLSNVLSYLVPLEDDPVGDAFLSATGEDSIHVVIAPRQRRKSRAVKQLTESKSSDLSSKDLPSNGMRASFPCKS